jgi:hypothetical protein
MNADQLIVFDTASRKVVARLPIAATCLALSPCAFPQALRNVSKIDVPGPTGQRFDYLAVDEEDHYVLSAHLGPGLLYVVDTKTDKVVKTIPGLSGITGLEYVPGFHKIYTSNWGEEKSAWLTSARCRLSSACPQNRSRMGLPTQSHFEKSTS